MGRKPTSWRTAKATQARKLKQKTALEVHIACLNGQQEESTENYEGMRMQLQRIARA
jgi:chaperonin cofactor prefoldin